MYKLITGAEASDNLEASALDALVMRVETAWTELQSFGDHPGECNFDGTCPTCGAKQGCCDLHAETMTRRLAEMQASVDKLRDFIGA